jgi:lysophospholipase L1-like esterase
MRIKTKAIRITAVLALALVAALPLWAARGKADFTRYVALGDSYGAGVSSNSMVDAHQKNGYVAVLATQTGAPNFQQPTVSQPGIGPELQLLSIRPLTILPKSSTNGVPTNLSLPRPYNNLSIPGARVNDLLTLTGKQPPTNTQTQFATFILRGLGTAADQALAQQPTFISVWIGGNDLLGAVLAGTPAALTPLPQFEASYNALMDRLVAGAPNAGIVIGSLADAKSVPFATTIPPVIVNPATSQPVLGPDGKPIYMIADLGGGTIGQLPPGSLVTLGASSFMATGYGIPPALAPLFPTLPNAGKPLPDGVVLTPAELAVIDKAKVDMNAVIIATGARLGIPVVDYNAFFEKVKGGLHFGQITLSASFLTGGVFSYDGFHPSDIGYTLLANEMIRTINANYGSAIPFSSITRYYQNNGKRTMKVSSDEEVAPGTEFVFTREATDGLLQITGARQNLPVSDKTME